MPPDQTQPAARRMLGNTAAQLVTPGLRILTGVGISAILGRYLGVHGYGEYAVVFAYVALFAGIFNQWGLETIALRDMSKVPRDRAEIVGTAVVMQTVIALGSYALLIGGLLVTPYSASVKAACAIYGLTMLLSPFDLLAVPLASELQVARGIPASVLANIVLLVGVGMVALVRGSLTTIIGVLFIGVLVQTAALTLIALRRYPVGRPSRPRALALLREAWPLGVGTVCSSITQHAPVLALSVLAVAQAGLFNAAASFPLQAVLVPLVLRNSTFPLLSASWGTDKRQFRHQLQRLLGVISFGGVILATAGVGLGRHVLSLVFGQSFAAGAGAFGWMTLTVAILFPGIILGEAMIVAGLHRYNMMAQLLSLPVLGALLVLLVPAYGATGAACSICIANVGILAFEIAVVRSRWPQVFPLGWTWRAGVVGILGVGAAVGLGTFGPISVVVGFMVSGLAAALLLRTDLQWLATSLRTWVAPLPEAA